MDSMNRLDLCEANLRTGYCKKCRCFVGVEDGQPNCADFNNMLDRFDPDSGEYDVDRE